MDGTASKPRGLRRSAHPVSSLPLWLIVSALFCALVATKVVHNRELRADHGKWVQASQEHFRTVFARARQIRGLAGQDKAQVDAALSQYSITPAPGPRDSIQYRDPATDAVYSVRFYDGTLRTSFTDVSFSDLRPDLPPLRIQPHRQCEWHLP